MLLTAIRVQNTTLKADNDIKNEMSQRFQDQLVNLREEIAMENQNKRQIMAALQEEVEKKDQVYHSSCVLTYRKLIVL